MNSKTALNWTISSMCKTDEPSCVAVSSDGELVLICNSTRPTEDMITVGTVQFSELVARIKSDSTMEPGDLMISAVEGTAQGCFTIHDRTDLPEAGIYYTRDEIDAFVLGVKAGEFDHLLTASLVG